LWLRPLLLRLRQHSNSSKPPFSRTAAVRWRPRKCARFSSSSRRCPFEWRLPHARLLLRRKTRAAGLARHRTRIVRCSSWTISGRATLSKITGRTRRPTRSGLTMRNRISRIAHRTRTDRTRRPTRSGPTMRSRISRIARRMRTDRTRHPTLNGPTIRNRISRIVRRTRTDRTRRRQTRSDPTMRNRISRIARRTRTGRTRHLQTSDRTRRHRMHSRAGHRITIGLRQRVLRIRLLMAIRN